MDKELEKLIYSLDTTGKDINDYLFNKDKEETFLSLIDGYVIKEDKKKYPDLVFYFNAEGEVLFELDEKHSKLWCNYYLVWNVFYDKYGMKSSEIQSFIKDMVEKHLKLKDVIPFSTINTLMPWVQELYKMRGITPNIQINFLHM